MKKPLGIILLSVFMLLIGSFMGFIGFSQPKGSVQEFIFYISLGAGICILALGLFFLRKWAKRGIVIFSWISLAFYVFLIGSLIKDSVNGEPTFYGIMVPLFFPLVLINIFCLFYFSAVSIRNKFN